MITRDATSRTLRAHGHDHLTIYIGRDGSVQLYPDGDAHRIASALRTLVRAWTEHPETIDCAAGTCDGSCPHNVRRS
jgi:hypothetical protein